jgi:hypothetical protein
MKQPTEQQTGIIPADVMSKLIMAMASVESALLTKDPELPKHLQESHRLLISYPETVHLLEDSEIAQLIKGAELLSSTQIVKDAVKGKANNKALARLSASDL